MNVERAKRNALLFLYGKGTILLYEIGKLWYNNNNIWISEMVRNRTERFTEMREYEKVNIVSCRRDCAREYYCYCAC